MNSLYVFGLLSLIASLTASPTVGDSSPVFDSEQQAVKAAADIYNPLSIRTDREYMGSIYRRQGKYGYTVSVGERGANSMAIRVPREDWDNVVALWHTHGGSAPNHRYFSDIDTEVVQRFALPFYLADYTGFLKVYRPGDRTLLPLVARRLGLPAATGYARGELVRDRYNRSVRVRTRQSRSSS